MDITKEKNALYVLMIIIITGLFYSVWYSDAQSALQP